LDIELLELSVIHSRGRIVPVITLSGEKQDVIFTGYNGGNSLVYKDGTQLMHWGFNHLTKKYDRPKYSNGANFAFVTRYLKAVHAVLDDEVFKKYIADCKDFKEEPVRFDDPLPLTERSYTQKTVFGALLAALSDHFKCDANSTTGDGYLTLRNAGAQKRVNDASDQGFSPNLAGVFT
jgi:hypothetical protein